MWRRFAGTNVGHPHVPFILVPASPLMPYRIPAGQCTSASHAIGPSGDAGARLHPWPCASPWALARL